MTKHTLHTDAPPAGCITTLAAFAAAIAIFVMVSCSNPLAGADQFEIGLAQRIQMREAASYYREQRLAALARTDGEGLARPARKLAPLAPLKPLRAAAKPVITYPEQPDAAGRFTPSRGELPLPLGGSASDELLPMGGAAR